MALGSTSRTLPIPGLAEHAMGFKTLSEAIALRNRLLLMLEQAETEDDDEVRRALLTVVFVGVGYAGLEGLAELQDLAADVVERYPRARLTGLRFLLVEAKERVMLEISPDLAAFATAELRRRGIEVHLNTQVERLDGHSVTLSTGEVVPSPHRGLDRRRQAASGRGEVGLPLDGGGRIATDRYTAVIGHPGVWAIGDAAAVPDPANKAHPSPPTAQHVLRQAKVAADNVAAALGGEVGRKRPFRYRDARRVRRHGRPPGGGEHPGHPLARLSRLVPGPHGTTSP